jgi:phage protein D
MSEDKSDTPAAAKRTNARDERLKAELRANLARRKQQTRARREGAEDARPGALLSQSPEDEAPGAAISPNSSR